MTEDQDMNNMQPMVQKTTVDPDIMYLHEALKQLDHQQFLKAMDKEIKANTHGKHWEIIP